MKIHKTLNRPVMAASKLSKLTSKHGQWVKDPSGHHVYHVTNPHVLVQAVGYVKFTEAKTAPCRILVRGQDQLYPSLRPSLYRDTKNEGGKDKQDRALQLIINSTTDKWAKAIPAYARSALLQHYGIKTSWLDVVDNMWVALWFSCHDSTSTGRRREYMHFDPRRASKSRDSFAYLILLRADDVPPQNEEPGLWRGGRTELIDLRVACPSHYVRPHAQHGLLVRRTGTFRFADADYQDLVAGIIRVDLADAQSWLGDGKLLSVRALFPPPTYGFGYGILLENAPCGPASLGAICIVGA